MNEKQLQGILNSDMKLWELAETSEEGDVVTKTLDLPYGIGKTEVRLEGITDGVKRRTAVQGFGDYIRGVVEERIGEESVTARAKQAAAKVSTNASYVPDGGGDDPFRPGGPLGGAAETIPDKETVASPNVVTFDHTQMANRASAIRERLEIYAEDMDTLRRELKGIEAYLEVYDAPAHKKTP